MNLGIGIIFLIVCCAIGWLIGHGASFIFEKFENVTYKHPILLFLIIAIAILIVLIGVNGQH